MSVDWVSDIEYMHKKYGVDKAVAGFDDFKLSKLLQFRTKFLEEELNELKTAKSADDVVDALIDLCVVAIGTLDMFDVDSYTAWNRVLNANLAKEVGIKESRPNPLGLPDLVKPEGWVAPTHEDNLGRFKTLFD